MFGCIAYAHVQDASRQKLDRKAEKFRFVSYSKVSKSYRLFNEKSKKIVIQRDVVFNEIEFRYKANGEPATTKEVMEVTEIDAEVDASAPAD